VSDRRSPFADVRPEPGGFSLPRLKWRELVFTGALVQDGDAWVRDPARPLPPFQLPDLLAEGLRFQVRDGGERVHLHPEGVPRREVLHADLALARRLEGADAAGARLAVREAARHGGPARILDVAGGVAAFLGPGSPLTHALALGLHGPVADDDLAAVEDFFASCGAESQLVLCPLADPSLLEAAMARGYRVREVENVLVRRLAAADAGLTSAWPVQACEEAGGWAGLVARGFGEGEVSEPALEVGRQLFDQVRSAGEALVALQDGAPAAAAAWFAADGVAYLLADATPPEARGRGGQQALIRARLARAQGAGCDLATATTAPGSGSQANYERIGFQVAYSRLSVAKGL
jgi:ribosomal protein S18 acetylase RimI-like enzyme